MERSARVCFYHWYTKEGTVVSSTVPASSARVPPPLTLTSTKCCPIPNHWRDRATGSVRHLLEIKRLCVWTICSISRQTSSQEEKEGTNKSWVRFCIRSINLTPALGVTAHPDRARSLLHWVPLLLASLERQQQVCSFSTTELLLLIQTSLWSVHAGHAVDVNHLNVVPCYHISVSMIRKTSVMLMTRSPSWLVWCLLWSVLGQIHVKHA